MRRKTRPSVVLDAIRRMVWEGEATISSLALRYKRTFRWGCTQESAEARVRQWLKFDDQHRWPAEAIEILCEESGLDYVSPILQRAVLRRELEHERQSA